MANERNIVPHRLKAGEARTHALAKAGGRASGEARRRRRYMREVAAELLDADAPDWMREKVGAPKGTTVQEVLVASLVAKAADGDVQAFRSVQALSDGEKSEREWDADVDEFMGL